MANYEDWTNSELADSLLDNEEFVENEVPEDEEENEDKELRIKQGRGSGSCGLGY